MKFLGFVVAFLIVLVFVMSCAPAGPSQEELDLQAEKGRLLGVIESLSAANESHAAELATMNARLFDLETEIATIKASAQHSEAMNIQMMSWLKFIFTKEVVEIVCWGVGFLTAVILAFRLRKKPA